MVSLTVHKLSLSLIIARSQLLISHQLSSVVFFLFFYPNFAGLSNIMFKTFAVAGQMVGVV